MRIIFVLLLLAGDLGVSGIGNPLAPCDLHVLMNDAESPHRVKQDDLFEVGRTRALTLRTVWG